MSILLKTTSWKYQVRFLVLLLFRVRSFVLRLTNLPDPSLDLSILLPFGSFHHPHYTYTGKTQQSFSFTLSPAVST